MLLGFYFSEGWAICSVKHSDTPWFAISKDNELIGRWLISLKRHSFFFFSPLPPQKKLSAYEQFKRAINFCTASSFIAILRSNVVDSVVVSLLLKSLKMAKICVFVDKMNIKRVWCQKVPVGQLHTDLQLHRW